MDYSDRSSVLYQVDYAEKLLKSGKITDALIRSRILHLNTKNFEEVDKINLKSIEKTEAAFLQSIEEKNWDEAVRYLGLLPQLENALPDGRRSGFLKRGISYGKRMPIFPY